MGPQTGHIFRNAHQQLCFAATLMASLGLLLGAAIGVKAQSASPAGTFYSLQRSNAPPFPYDPWPELPYWTLGNNIFLVDDSSVDYTSGEQSSILSPPVPGSGGAGDTNAPIPAYDYAGSCAFWLEIAATNNNAILTLHNSASGRSYSIWSKESLSLTNWTLETNFLGASGQDWTQVSIAMGQRTNLFFRASELREYVVNTNSSFQGLSGEDISFEPPDSMMAVGPDHVVELLNGKVAVFPKTNGPPLQVRDVTNFFALTDNGTNYPQRTAIDPRILYDPVAQRWIASMIDFGGAYNVILAVSKTNTPLDLLTNWDKYLIRIARPSDDSDYDTLGMDQNGIYLSVIHRRNLTNDGFTIAAIKKTDICNGINRYTLLTNNPGLTSWCIQPAVNFDNIASNGFAWFVAKGPPEYGARDGTNYYQGGAVYYRRLQWLVTNADWVETNWVSVPSANGTYRDYYDLDGTNQIIAQGADIGAPQAGGTNKIALGDVGSRLMMAVIRNGFLWTCQHVGLSGTNGAYSGDQTGTNVDRSAAQWLKFQITAGGTALAHSEYGRVFDPAPTNAFWYYFPSLMVNCAGDMMMGFSGSSPTSYIGAFYSSRLAESATSTGPVLIKAGAGYYFISDRWGDYSITLIDPTDDRNFWTVQEYADPAFPYPWATWIVNLPEGP